jgi:hypothetical protein
MNWTLIWQAVKEPLREIVLAILPVVMATIAPNTAPWAVGLYLILRFIDQVLHEMWKDNPTNPNGLIRF